MSTITAAMKILESANRPGTIVPRNTVIFRQLLARLGNPHEKLRCFHVTGTNGKGSVALKVAAVMENAGYKSGLYISPHLFSFRQRIQINRQSIPTEKFGRQILRIHKVAEQNRLQLTFFQYLTAAGFCEFNEQKCDFASIEVGMGARFDTTSVVNPIVSAITSIGLDHQNILGSTLDSIAFEKAGIIKSKTPVVLGPTCIQACIQEEAQKLSAPIIRVPSHSQDFEFQNNAIAIECLKKLKGTFQISDQAIKEGLKARQPCRMEELDLKYIKQYMHCKKVIFDVGHNSAAIKQLIKYYNNNSKQAESVQVLFGTSKAKNVRQTLDSLSQFARLIYLVEPKHPRGMPLSTLQSYVGETKNPSRFRIVGDGDIKRTLDYMTLDPTVSNIIVCGSFFIMPEARGYFEPGLLASDGTGMSEAYELRNSQI